MKKYSNIIFILILLTISIASHAKGLKIKVIGNGQPMILIPGLTCDGAVWDETVAKYKDHYECHIITLPGFAGNPRIDFHNDYLETMEKLLMDYIKENKLKKPVIVGHSLGGFLALSMAKNHPGLFDKLVIVDSLPFLMAAQMPNATMESAKLFAENMKKMMLNSANSDNGDTQKMMLQSMINDPKDIEIAYEWGKASDIETVAQAMYELYTTDLREEISKIESPILVMGAWIAYKNYGATRENTMLKYTSQFAKAKNCQVKMTDIGKHFIMWDDPTFFFHEMDNFIN